jgi:hypothetical protein
VLRAAMRGGALAPIGRLACFRVINHRPIKKKLWHFGSMLMTRIAHQSPRHLNVASDAPAAETPSTSGTELSVLDRLPFSPFPFPLRPAPTCSPQI